MTHEIGDQLAAVGRVDDFGMELGAVVLLFVIGDDGEGAPSETATMRKPGANWVTLSPWLIHT
jgi:hypothetical protein